MIEVKVTNDMFLTAREKSVEVGKLNNSILNGGGNLAGFIGEIIVRNRDHKLRYKIKETISPNSNGNT